MAKAPAKPRPSTRRRRRPRSERTKSGLGRLAAAGIGIASTAGVLTGLAVPAAEQPSTCGGALVNRWPVKVATDQDAIAGKINLEPGNNVYSVSQLNQQVKPGAIDAPGGRMEA